MSEPSPNGSNGDRDARGRFTAGNSGGPGNPHAKRTAELRAELLRTVTEQDVREVVGALLDKAKSGDIPAIRELFDRLFGKAPQDFGVVADLKFDHPRMDPHKARSEVSRILDRLDPDRRRGPPSCDQE